MRTNLIKKYLADQEVYEIIGHHVVVYIKIIARYLLILGAIALLHSLITTNLTTHPLVTRLAAGCGIIVYCMGLYKFIDEYLDALVITSM